VIVFSPDSDSEIIVKIG